MQAKFIAYNYEKVTHTRTYTKDNARIFDYENYKLSFIKYFLAVEVIYNHTIW